MPVYDVYRCVVRSGFRSLTTHRAILLGPDWLAAEPLPPELDEQAARADRREAARARGETPELDEGAGAVRVATVTAEGKVDAIRQVTHPSPNCAPVRSGGKGRRR